MTHQHQISSKICRSIINPTTRFSNPTCLTPRTEVHFERKAEKKHTAHKEREGMKKRDIKLKYPDAAKADALTAFTRLVFGITIRTSMEIRRRGLSCNSIVFLSLF